MNNYEKHAMMEFKAAGWLDENGEFNDEMQKMICDHVMKLLDVFAEEGHSGSSAPYAINLFSKLAKFEPVAPLTGEDWEWTDVSDMGGGKKWYQNNRCSHVFKDENGAYDSNGKVFWEWARDSDGEAYKAFYTSRESSVPVTFPYVPKVEYVWRWSDADPRTPSQTEEGFL